MLKTKTVMLGGVGLLGNEVASNLAILGVGQFILIDYGDVDWFNIYRQPLFSVDDVFSKKVTAVEETLLKMGGIVVTPLAMEVPCLASDPSKKRFQESITKLRRHVEESDVIVGAFDIDKAEEILGVPNGYGIVSLVPLGYPAKGAPAPGRREISEFTHLNKF